MLTQFYANSHHMVSLAHSEFSSHYKLMLCCWKGVCWNQQSSHFDSVLQHWTHWYHDQIIWFSHATFQTISLICPETHLTVKLKWHLFFSWVTMFILYLKVYWKFLFVCYISAFLLVSRLVRNELCLTTIMLCYNAVIILELDLYLQGHFARRLHILLQPQFWMDFFSYFTNMILQTVHVSGNSPFLLMELGLTWSHSGVYPTLTREFQGFRVWGKFVFRMLELMDTPTNLANQVKVGHALDQSRSVQSRGPERTHQNNEPSWRSSRTDRCLSRQFWDD